MKKAMIMVCALLLFVLAITFLVRQTPSVATPDPEKTEASTAGLTIARLEIAGNVVDRMPVEIASSFPASQEKVYCYLDFRDVEEETAVTVMWSLEQDEMGKVPLTIKPYERFRTWASKAIYGMQGDWSVDVLNEEGFVIKSAAFTVQ
jgi:hypothetical protein